MKSPSATPQIQLTAVALNVEGGVAPEWIELIPAGFDVVGRDGRTWINPDPADVVAMSAVERQPIPLDWEHSTEVRAPAGQEAPAAGWIEGLEVRDGAIWGKVAWTERGADQVTSKAYRFVSPVFSFEKATRRIRRLTSAALTNTPNLHLTALNREDRDDASRDPEDTLDIAKLKAALGLADDASDDAILEAAKSGVAANTELQSVKGQLETAKAANRSGVDLTSYAPRADLETAVNRANTAETKLKELEAKGRDAEIDAAIAGAMDAGKVIPASEDMYRAMCREEGGLERFKKLAETLPVIVGAAEQRALNRKVEDAKGSGLTDEEKAVCRQLGQSEDDFLKAKQERNA